MKKIYVTSFLLLIAFCTFNFSSTTIKSEEQKYYFTSNVEHLFTHCLIAYPELAFHKNNYMRKHLDTDCITSSEFKSILNELFLNNYILVSIEDCFYIDSNEQAKKKTIKVPFGKKPLILSFDDVNYDQKKLNKGMVDKIVVDNNGILASSTFKNGNEIIEYDKEFIPILESFIKSHPSFSLNGAKGTLCLTGYDGILGYRTSHNNTKNRKKEIESAKKVVEVLKKNGWSFACHSYGHYHMKKISLPKFKNELDLWNQEIVPIIGNTNIYVYPYGEWEVFNNGQYSDKHQLLITNGFKLFCGVGMKSYYSYLPNNNNLKVLFMDRKCVDGRTLKNNHYELHKFFNPLAIVDKKRPNI